jgi:hypothetical protein
MSSASRSPICFTASGPIVDISIRVAPDAIPFATPSSPKTTCSTASGEANIVMTASAPAAASAGEPASVAPALARRSAFSGVRFQTTNS